MITRIEQARPAVLCIALIVLMAAVFVPMSRLRLVDGDEGTYILNSRLVMEGQLLFHDLFWPQMFLTPYLYGTWMKTFGNSWYGARFLSALVAIALGLLLYRQAARLTGRRTWGVLAAVIFTFTSLEFGWLPLIKTFAFGTLFLFSAYAVQSLSSWRHKWTVSGLLLGLAIDVRLYVIFTIPAFLVDLYLAEPRVRERLLQLASFVVGLVLALLPNLFFYLIDPETFVFNIIGVHAIRSPWGFFGYLPQKGHVVLQLLAIHSADGVTSLQFVLLFFVGLASWVSCALARSRPPLASMIFILLVLASLIPTPVYTQYFSMTMPFLIVDVVVFIARLAAEAAAPAFRQLGAVFVAIYILLSPFDFYRYTVTGEGFFYFHDRSELENWKIPTIRAVGQAIDQEIRPERPVAISFWPGYFAETAAHILPKMENHFTIDFSRSMTERDIEKFKFMSYPELYEHLHRHTVDVVVLGNWITERHAVRALIVDNGYALVRRVGNAEIYKLPPERR